MEVLGAYFSDCVSFPTGTEFRLGTPTVPTGQPGSSERSGCPWPRPTPWFCSCSAAVSRQLWGTGAPKDIPWGKILVQYESNAFESLASPKPLQHALISLSVRALGAVEHLVFWAAGRRRGCLSLCLALMMMTMRKSQKTR